MAPQFSQSEAQTMSDQHQPEAPEGWVVTRKRICCYLGVSWHTVRRWHVKHGLPLRQTKDGMRALDKAEADAWLKGREEGSDGD